MAEGKARVDEEKCIVCAVCEDACPSGAITVGDTAVVDQEKCNGCESCIEACPSEAISIVAA